MKRVFVLSLAFFFLSGFTFGPDIFDNTLMLFDVRNRISNLDGIIFDPAASQAEKDAASALKILTIAEGETYRILTFPSLLTGSGAPSGGLGADGDMYMDTSAQAMYGPKSSGSWGSATPLVGPQGSAGLVSASSPLSYNSGTQTVSVLTASGSQAGVLSSDNWTTFNSKIGSVSYSASNPTRTLNSNFQPSASNVVDACYTISFACSISLGGTCTGTVELRTDSAATPTTYAGKTEMSIGGTLVIGLTLSNGQKGQVCAKVLPGHNVRLVSSGTATMAVDGSREVAQIFAQ